jgi:hypothetical protein
MIEKYLSNINNSTIMSIFQKNTAKKALDNPIMAGGGVKQGLGRGGVAVCAIALPYICLCGVWMFGCFHKLDLTRSK